jgi:hypothetical protein
LFDLWVAQCGWRDLNPRHSVPKTVPTHSYTCPNVQMCRSRSKFRPPLFVAVFPCLKVSFPFHSQNVSIDDAGNNPTPKLATDWNRASITDARVSAHRNLPNYLPERQLQGPGEATAEWPTSLMSFATYHQISRHRSSQNSQHRSLALVVSVRCELTEDVPNSTGHTFSIYLWRVRDRLRAA